MLNRLTISARTGSFWCSPAPCIADFQPVRFTLAHTPIIGTTLLTSSGDTLWTDNVSTDLPSPSPPALPGARYSKGSSVSVALPLWRPSSGLTLMLVARPVPLPRRRLPAPVRHPVPIPAVVVTPATPTRTAVVRPTPNLAPTMSLAVVPFVTVTPADANAAQPRTSVAMANASSLVRRPTAAPVVIDAMTMNSAVVTQVAFR